MHDTRIDFRDHCDYVARFPDVTRENVVRELILVLGDYFVEEVLDAVTHLKGGVPEIVVAACFEKALCFVEMRHRLMLNAHASSIARCDAACRLIRLTRSL